MAMQVITIHQDGAVSGLQMKPGKGLSLKDLKGKARIDRVSLVEWDVDEQKWYVVFLKGPFKGERLTDNHFARAGLSTGGTDEPLYFNEYEEGVDAEVRVIQGLMVAGHWYIVD